MLHNRQSGVDAFGYARSLFAPDAAVELPIAANNLLFPRTVPPVAALVAAASNADTLVLNVSEIAMNGKDAEFTLLLDGKTVGGTYTVTAAETTGKSQQIVLTTALAAGTHSFGVDFINGFTGNPADYGRTLFVNSITADNQTQFTNGAFMYNGVTNYTVSKPASPIASNAGTNDKLVLNVSGTPASGQNPQFMVSVDGQQVGSIETVTASHAAGASQSFTLAGNFGSGAHNVVVDLLNGWAGAPGDVGRALYVNSLVLDSGTAVRGTEQTYRGTQSYVVTSGTGTVGTSLAVAISSQKLAADTGASSTDRITSNGSIALAGTDSGPSGTGVEIYDNATALGAATVLGGAWSWSGALSQGTHALHASASDPQGQTVTTAAEPGVVVQTTAPTSVLSTPSQTLSASGSTAHLTLTGTVAGLAGTVVQVMDGNTALGMASVSGSIWSYGASLSVGTHTLSALATDLAGNAGKSSTDTISVTGTTASGLHLTGNTGNPLGSSGLVTYNWNPATQLSHWIAAETAMANGVVGAKASIVAFGDSTTQGVGAPVGQSYPDYLNAYLAQDSGVATQETNFNGDYADGSEITMTGGAAYNYGLNGLGGAMVQLSSAGQGFIWTPTTSGNYDRLGVSYWDNGSGTITVTGTGGSAGSFSQTLQLGNTGNMVTQTLDIPVGAYSHVSVTADGSSSDWIEGMSLSNNESPAIQLYNGGVGGAWSSVAGNGSLTGVGEFPGGLGLHPSLALIDYGINDILDDTYTAAQTTANIATMIAECRAANCDPVIIVPEPFGLNPLLPNNISSISQLVTDLQALSVQDNVPIIDLNATYGGNPATYLASNLVSAMPPHPSAAGYQDIASRIAALLTNTTQTYPNSTAYQVPGAITVTGTHGSDVLFSTATVNTLIGTGGTDTYVMNPNDVTDTIINGTTGSSTPSGQLDVMSAAHTQLWFSQSGQNLVVNVLGSTHQAIIQNWFSGAGNQLSNIYGSDGIAISTASVNASVMRFVGADVETPATATADLQLQTAMVGANTVPADFRFDLHGASERDASYMRVSDDMSYAAAYTPLHGVISGPLIWANILNHG